MGEVLREQEHGATLDLAPPGHDRVAVRTFALDAEAARLMARQRVDLVEGSLVDEQLDPFARRQLSEVVLSIHGSLAVGLQRLLA